MKLKLDEPDRALGTILGIVVLLMVLMAAVSCAGGEDLTVCSQKMTKDCSVSRSEPESR